MSIAYRLFDEFSLPLLFACVVFAHRLSRIRPRCCHCLSLIVHFLRCSPQSRHRASHVTHSPRTAHVAHRRTSIAHCLSLTSPIVYRPSPIVYRPLSIAHRPLSIAHRSSLIAHRPSLIDHGPSLIDHGPLKPTPACILYCTLSVDVTVGPPSHWGVRLQVMNFQSTRNSPWREAAKPCERPRALVLWYQRTTGQARLSYRATRSLAE